MKVDCSIVDYAVKPQRIEVRVATTLGEYKWWYWTKTSYQGYPGTWADKPSVPRCRASREQSKILSRLVMSHPFLQQFVKEYGISLCGS